MPTNSKNLPRGIRNNNPGNIERNTKDKWQGLAETQTDKRFCQFTDAVYGIRAIARILITYQDRYGVNTLIGAIRKWAPAPENKPTAYAQAISARTGIDTGGVIDFHVYRYLRPIVEGIIQQENGVMPYTAAQLDKALALAGVEPPKQSVNKSSTMKAATVGVSGSTIAGGAATIAAVGPAVPVIRDTVDVVKDYGLMLIIIAAVAVAGLFGFIAYRRWDDSRRLAR